MMLQHYENKSLFLKKKKGMGKYLFLNESLDN